MREHILRDERWLIDTRNLAREGRFNIAVVYPNSYSVASSNLGFHFCLRETLAIPGIGVERFFQAISSRRNRTHAGSLESGTRLNNFHLVLFSISSELDYLHIPPILKLNGIPVFREERTSHDPMIIAGGFAVMVNPLPLSGIFDLFVIGDAETTLPHFLEQYMHFNGDSDEVRMSLEGKGGFFFPGNNMRGLTPERILSRYKKTEPFTGNPAHSVFVTPRAEFSDTFLVEISRGCPFRCRFCFVGNNANPFRSHSAGDIINSLSQAQEYTRRVGLIASALPAASTMNSILDYIEKNELSASLSSLRMTDISPGLVGGLAGGGQYSLTIAPECGNERLRRSIGKDISDEQVMHSVRMCLEEGIRKIKFYFLVGLPNETDADIVAIAKLLTRIKEEFAEHFSFTLTAGIGIFTPRPSTPMSEAHFCGIDAARKKIKLIEQELKKNGSGVSLTTASPHEAALETLLGNYGDEARAFMVEFTRTPRRRRALLRRYHPLLTGEESND